MINDNIRKKAKDYLPYEIRYKNRDFLKKYIFYYKDMRNFHVIGYFTHTTRVTAVRLFPECDCGMLTLLNMLMSEHRSWKIER